MLQKLQKKWSWCCVFYNPLDILTHACYGLNEKCSSQTHVLNVCAHLVVLCGEDGEPAGGEDPLAEKNRLLGTHTPLKVKSSPWFLRKYGFNYGTVPMCKDGRQSFLPHAGSVQHFNTATYHARTTTIISGHTEVDPEGSSW